MKKGKWNYIEDILYTVVLVRLHEVEGTPLHWQNVFAGQERQVVEVMHNKPDGSEYVFTSTIKMGQASLKLVRWADRIAIALTCPGMTSSANSQNQNGSNMISRYTMLTGRR